MALIVADRVQETTNSTGTGAYTLGGAVPGFQTFASEVSNADTVYYSVTDNVDFEVGLGTYASSGGTITRTTVFTSSNSNSAVNWGVGTKNIFLTYPADKAVVEDASNNVTIGNNLVVGGTVDGRDVAADGTKLDFVTVTQAVNLDQMETDIAALENGMVYKGDWNAGSGSFPGSGSAQTGWFYYVSGAGTVNGISFTVGDNIVATTDNASTSTYASNWSKHDQTDAVQAVVGLTGSIAKGSLLSALNVEDGADVTDTANVTSAGALMDSEVTNLAQVKAFNSSDYATAAQGTTANNALPKAGGTMSGNIDGNGNKMLFANMYANLVDLPSATTYHGMFAHVHATGKAYFAHSGAWVPLANESTTLALAGGTMTGDVLYNDNIKAIFGAGSDASIFSDGTSGYARNFTLQNLDGTKDVLTFTDGGATNLFYNNAPKLATTSTGVQVSGNISNATGDFTLDVAGDITLDADGGDFRFKDAGTTVATYANVSGSWYITSNVLDADIVFQGNDNGSTIAALTLDMSDGGTASFNSHIRLGDNKTASFGTGFDIEITSDGTNGTIGAPNGDLTLDVAGGIILDADDSGTISLKDAGTRYGVFSKSGNNFDIQPTISDGDIVFKGNDGGSSITALTLDMSEGGIATFGSHIELADNKELRVGNSHDLKIYHDAGGFNQIVAVNDHPVQIKTASENMIKAIPNGAVELYHNNSKKFETTSTGIQVTGNIANASGDFTLDVAGDIILDADGADVLFHDGGLHYASIRRNGEDAVFKSIIQDKDIIFKGNDGGVEREVLRLDMSEEGTAIFNNNVLVGGHTNTHSPVGNGGSGVSLLANGQILAGGQYPSYFNREDSDGDIAVFRKDGSTVGSIATQAWGFNFGGSGTNSNGISCNGANALIPLKGMQLSNNTQDLGSSTYKWKNGYFSGSLYGDGSNLTGITDTTYSAGAGLNLSGTTFSLESDARGDLFYMGRDGNDYFVSQTDKFQWFLDGNEDMRLENDGDLHVDGNVVAYSTTTSDERLKKDIVKIDNALDKVSQLSGYTFEYLADGKKSAGVIAQEVEKVMPSAVSETTLPLKSDDDQEYKVVQYDQLHGLLIEAIKELKAEIEELKAR